MKVQEVKPMAQTDWLLSCKGSVQNTFCTELAFLTKITKMYMLEAMYNQSQ